MANITPDTDVYILKGVPLDKDNEVTFYWGTSGNAIARQINYFLGQNGQGGFVKYHLDKLSYQRVGDNRIRVGYGSYSSGLGFPASCEGKIADALQDCNYIVFANKSSSIVNTPRWYYAFITEPPTYINPNTAEIQYEIDPLQTWLPGIDYNFEDCFVLREHIAKENDTPGANLEPEPVEPGEYIYNISDGVYGRLTNFTTDMLTVMCVGEWYDSGEFTFKGSFVDNNYSGLMYYIYRNEDNNIPLDGGGTTDFLTAIHETLAYTASHPESIISMYTIPHEFLATWWKNRPYSNDQYSNGGAKYLDWNAKVDTDTIEIDTIGHLVAPVDYSQTKTLLGAYKPINNKLYTYPYNFYCVDNSSDETLVLRYEFFVNGEPKLKGYPCFSPPVSIVFQPIGYKNAGEAIASRTDNITISGFPLCPWISDYYQAYMAQNAISIGTNALLGVGRAGVGIATGNPFAVMTGAGSIMESLAQTHAASIHADVPHGKHQTAGGYFAHKIKELNGGRMSITGQRAQRIDEFFTRYGYATNRLKKPGIGTRKYFNYTKVEKCAIKSNSDTSNLRGVPADEAKKICDFMNRGLTWWQAYVDGTYDSANHIGDFNLYAFTN